MQGFTVCGWKTLLIRSPWKAWNFSRKMKMHRSFFGSGITTRNLYDQVVGIGNVQIHLYKIEAQREYPITWKEVSRNSGGEGFLSAFVILSSFCII